MATENIAPEILEAALWVQQQINKNPYCDCGFSVSVHHGDIRRTDYKLTIKKMAVIRDEE